ncbi:hypothetical protein [Micromonospora sp. NPDC051141]|uniref:hypothetical protein n=1 Tax=Micromonospora sp. NPDC051141 TaxID=3364284 RepID=UPI0037AB1051
MTLLEVITLSESRPPPKGSPTPSPDSHLFPHQVVDALGGPVYRASPFAPKDVELAANDLLQLLGRTAG